MGKNQVKSRGDWGLLGQGEAHSGEKCYLCSVMGIYRSLSPEEFRDIQQRILYTSDRFAFEKKYVLCPLKIPIP